MDYLVVAIFGASVGLSELITRYRDEPQKVICRLPGLAYISINIFAALAALFVISVFDLRFGLNSDAETISTKLRVVRVMVAGFGAMAFLRSSLFTVRVGNQDVGIGFSAIIQSYLRAADSAADRLRGVSRASAVALMDDVDFERAVEALTAYCLALMQNLSIENQAAFAQTVKGIKHLDADSKVKSQLLGLAIINFMGEDVLTAAVKSIGDYIKRSEP